MIAIGEGVLRDALAMLNHCGAGRHECVLLFSGPRGRAGVIDEALHPEHTAGPGGYEIDPDWMHELWLSLVQADRTLRAQIHSHPRGAGHSACDDPYPAVHTPGFVSLVVPRFAHPPVDFAAIHASVLEADGWRRSTFMKEVDVV
jgi:hypothetical protein